MTLVVKTPPANAGDIRDMGSIPGSRAPGGGHSNPRRILAWIRGTWQAMVQSIAKNQTRMR